MKTIIYVIFYLLLGNFLVIAQPPSQNYQFFPEEDYQTTLGQYQENTAKVRLGTASVCSITSATEFDIEVEFSIEQDGRFLYNNNQKMPSTKIIKGNF